MQQPPATIGSPRKQPEKRPHAQEALAGAGPWASGADQVPFPSGRPGSPLASASGAWQWPRRDRGGLKRG
eukprot:15448672-Alexandrium_andersonii.AAC.1